MRSNLYTYRKKVLKCRPVLRRSTHTKSASPTLVPKPQQLQGLGYDSTSPSLCTYGRPGYFLVGLLGSLGNLLLVMWKHGKTCQAPSWKKNSITAPKSEGLGFRPWIALGRFQLRDFRSVG